ncbi:hypothetical protein LUZ60_000931 [Juncus effusus]|nr:hypothetical protein LUZ60_000931 [Juncus effusus]
MLRSWGPVRVPLQYISPTNCSSSPLFASSSSSSFSSPFLLSTSSATANQLSRAHMAGSTVRIAVVGDVHDDWELEEDSKALHFLQPDLVLFTGDYGNENVELVRRISDLKMPKAAILGNHDCWHTHQFSEKKLDRVQLQLQCLGQEHVGYKRLDFDNLKLSVLGGRPFSCGGDRLYRPRLLSKRYGVNDMEESAKKIYESAVGTPDENFVILLAHNGPTGLGSKVSDICGRDWVLEGGDHGDPDLAQAISDIQSNTEIRIPLVVFGHMHKRLAYGKGTRNMISFGENQIIYLNGAVVPRVKYVQKENCATSSSSTDEPNGSKESVKGTLRGFTIVDMCEGKVRKIAEIWILTCGDRVEVDHEIVLYENV